MTNSSAESKSAPRFSAAVARGLREAAAIGLGLMALILLLALLSFDARDPGFSYTGSGDAIHNRVGSAGAWLADLLYFLFGRPALLIPLALGVMGFRLARSRPEGEGGSRANAAVRALAFGVLLASSCALAALHWSPGVLRQSAGGVVGLGVGSAATAVLELLGATLLFLAAWGASAAVAFGISWLRVADGLGAAAWRAFRFLRERWQLTREVNEGRERKQARMEAGEAETRKQRARIPPRIDAPAPAVARSDR
ncbi:MAG TPA: DNA translocase FtsK 4TM domain-containing protein, partial [Steroidobacteraceae bacterium]